MIKMVRLDERMIHGQIAIKWSRHLDVNRIIVANDEAAANPVIQQSLMMAAPATCKTAIVPMDKAIELCNDPRSEALRILLIVARPEDLLRAVTEIKVEIPVVNAGNYGRIAPKQGTEARKLYDQNLFLYENEREILKQVVATGIPCIMQTTPELTAQDLKKLLG